nr:thiamine-phosphate kinase [Thiorhodovibrio winogradskyi]
MNKVIDSSTEFLISSRSSGPISYPGTEVLSTTADSGEFSLIQRFLTGRGAARDDVELDIGDDCAVTQIPAGFSLAFSIDTLVSGVHFFADADPQSLGHKSLAVSLSDLAAVGAKPAWATLALTLPSPDSCWLECFSLGLHELARQFGVRLVGGDLTRGPLTISIQAMGLVKSRRALRRSGAEPGDLIVVSGQLGDAALALQRLLLARQQGKQSSARVEAIEPELRERLEWPTPRVELGLGLVDLATAAIDISDGLLADLGHLLEQSGRGGELEINAIPLSPASEAVVRKTQDWSLPLSGGDDYELCFTVPQANLKPVLALGMALNIPLAVIGHITKQNGIRLRYPNGEILTGASPLTGQLGYDHFRQNSSDD